MPYLVIENLTKRFGTLLAVDAVSLTLEQGELVTLLGPSGCGKSTILRCIAGLEIPDGGRIVVDGTVLSEPDRGIAVPPEQRRIAMVFQSYALWPHMTVLENVAYPLRSRRLPEGEVRRRAAAALRLVGLQDYEGAQPGHLSGGQQQRVALARALAAEARLLLFDEPLSNLDANLREQIREEIRDLQRRLGFTALYVTHDQSEALSISDRVAVMEQGRIVQVGTPRAVYTRPATPFVAQFLGAVNLLACRAEGERTPDGREVLALPGGQRLLVQAAPDQPRLARGAAVYVGLRPELIRLRAGPPGYEENGLAVTVVAATFLGDRVDYTMAAGDLRLRVRTPPYTLLAIGEAATAAISPADCFVLPAPAPSSGGGGVPPGAPGPPRG